MINTSRLFSALRFILTIAALVWIGLFFLENRSQLAQAIFDIGTGNLLAAAACVLIGLVPGAVAWQRLLSRELPGVTPGRGVLIYLRSGIGKYTPGGVLAFAIQHRLLAADEVPNLLLVRVFVGTALAACLSASLIGAWAAVAALGAQPWVATSIVLIGTCGFLGVALYIRKWPSKLDNLGRIGMPPPVPFATTVTIMAVAWGLTGLHLAVLGLDKGTGMLFFVSSYALSAIVGIVFAVLPGALGVRDGALLMLLSLKLEPADAMTLALLSRALIIVGDVVGAVAAGIALEWNVVRTKQGSLP